MTGKHDDHSEEKGGWEALEEESEAALAPNAELEEAMREAADAVEARQSERKAAHEAPAAESAALQEELAKTQERLLRLQADFDNARKRMLKERQEAHQYGHENLVKDLLGTVDNLDRAIEHARSSDGGDFESMLQGVELVRREFLGVLDKHGVVGIEADGKAFDPEVHEALSQEEDASVPTNTVVRVFQKGYRLRDRLLRPARVVVSKGGEAGAGSEKATAPEGGAES